MCVQGVCLFSPGLKLSLHCEDLGPSIDGGTSWGLVCPLVFSGSSPKWRRLVFVKPVGSPKQLLSLLLPSLVCSRCIHRRKLNCRLCNGASGPQGLSVPESSARHQNICEGTGLPQGCGCSHSPPPWHPWLLRA